MSAAHAEQPAGAKPSASLAAQAAAVDDRPAASSDEDRLQQDMDLQKALKIISKHYVSRNSIVSQVCLLSPELQSCSLEKRGSSLVLLLCMTVQAKFASWCSLKTTIELV